MKWWGSLVAGLLGAALGYYVNGPISAAVMAATGAVAVEFSRRSRPKRSAGEAE